MQEPQRICPLSLVLALSITAGLIAACGSDDGTAPPPTLTVPAAVPTIPEASGNTPPWQLPRSDGAIGVLATDWGPRPDWNSGWPGAGAAILLPLDAQNGEELTGYEPFNLGHFYETALSPDGKLLAVSASATQEPAQRVFRLIDPFAWLELPVASGLPQGLELVAWQPDGSRVFLKAEDYLKGGVTLYAVQVSDGSWHKIGDVPVRTWAQPPLAPDGATIYLPAYRSSTNQCCGIDVEGDPYLVAFDTATGAQRGLVTLTGVTMGQRIEESSDGGNYYGVGYSPGLAMSPDGAYLYIAHADEDRVTVIDLKAMKVELSAKLAKARSGLSGALAWFEDQLVATAEAKGGLNYRKTATVTLDGRHLLITGTRDVPCKPSDDFPCATQPVGLQVVDLRTMKLVRTLPGIDRVVSTGAYLLGTGVSIDWDNDRGASSVTSHGLSVVDANGFDVVFRVEPERPLRANQLSAQAAVSPDARYAYYLTEGEGWTGDSKHGTTCTADCRRITAVDLERRQVVAQRSLVQHYVNLISLAR